MATETTVSNTWTRYPTHARVRIFDIVKAGFAGCTTGKSVRHQITDRKKYPWPGLRAVYEVVRTLGFFLGMKRMLSDQALKQGHLGDALAHTGDEGRSTLR